MNAHSARFSARRKGSSEPKPQVFLKVLAQKSSNRRVSSRFLAVVCLRTSEQLLPGAAVRLDISLYRDGRILFKQTGGAGPRPIFALGGLRRMAPTWVLRP